jgi:flagellar hook assembly protein FlgD
LYNNYPNPFNPVTTLRYDLPVDALVNITIYDMMGRVVNTLINESQSAGYKTTQWNATNYRNEPVSAGLYLYTIEAGKFRQTKKMVLLK